ANIPVTASPSTYQPFVSAITASTPNLVLPTNLTYTTLGDFNLALAGAGYKGANQNFVGYVPGLPSTSPQFANGFNGTLVNSQTVPQEEQTEYVKQIERDLTAIKASTGTLITQAIALAYAQADLVVSQLKFVGATLNTKTFDEQINGGGYHYVVGQAGGPG